MIHHSFHIDSFSTTVEFTCISFTTTCYLNFCSVLIFPQIFVYPVNRLNILISRNRFMSSLKVLYFSFNGFSKRIRDQLFSEEDIYRTRRSNYSPISHSGTRFSSEKAQLSSGEAKLLRLSSWEVYISSNCRVCRLWARVVCYALSNQVSKFVVNIDLEAEMEPCNRSSGRSETKYESCEKQML